MKSPKTSKSSDCRCQTSLKDWFRQRQKHFIRCFSHLSKTEWNWILCLDRFCICSSRFRSLDPRLTWVLVSCNSAKLYTQCHRNLVYSFVLFLDVLLKTKKSANIKNHKIHVEGKQKTCLIIWNSKNNCFIQLNLLTCESIELIILDLDKSGWFVFQISTKNIYLDGFCTFPSWFRTLDPDLLPEHSSPASLPN